MGKRLICDFKKKNKMRINDLFEKWGLTKLKLKTPLFDVEFQADDKDKDAAWDMYVELLTRITTQPLEDNDGVEKAALNSVHNLFGITREIIHNHGRKSVNFTKVAIIILNKVVRPFTAKWHKIAEEKSFDEKRIRDDFRNELKELQKDLVNYSRLLSELAGVHDFTDINKID